MNPTNGSEGHSPIHTGQTPSSQSIRSKSPLTTDPGKITRVTAGMLTEASLSFPGVSSSSINREPRRPPAPLTQSRAQRIEMERRIANDPAIQAYIHAPEAGDRAPQTLGSMISGFFSSLFRLRPPASAPSLTGRAHSLSSTAGTPGSSGRTRHVSSDRTTHGPSGHPPSDGNGSINT